MATAKRVGQGQKPVKKDVVTYEDRPSGVMLSLTRDEAETLALVLRKIGGHPQASRRKFTDTIDRALMGAIGPPQHLLADYAHRDTAGGTSSGIFFTPNITDY